MISPRITSTSPEQGPASHRLPLDHQNVRMLRTPLTTRPRTALATPAISNDKQILVAVLGQHGDGFTTYLAGVPASQNRLQLNGSGH